jgi:hypothetical protein
MAIPKTATHKVLDCGESFVTNRLDNPLQWVSRNSEVFHVCGLVRFGKSDERRAEVLVLG